MTSRIPFVKSESSGRNNSIDLNQEHYAPELNYPSHEEYCRNLEIYRSSFSITIPERIWSAGYMIEPRLFFDTLVCGPFNGNLARDMSISKFLVEKKDIDHWQMEYSLENCIVRICSIWEYLFQAIAEYLGLGQSESLLGSKKGVEALVSAQAYDVNFLDSGSIDYSPKDYRTAMRHIRYVRKNISSLSVGKKGKPFFRKYKKTYAPTSWIDELRALFTSQPSTEIWDLRNTISHQSPLLSPQARVDTDIILGGVGVSITPGDKSKEARERWEQIERAHCDLGKAITVIREAVYGNYLPNRKENEGKVFTVLSLKCPDPDCNGKFKVPCVESKENRAPVAFPCPNCGIWRKGGDFIAKEKLSCPDIVYSSILNVFLKSMEKHARMYTLSDNLTKEAGEPEGG